MAQPDLRPSLVAPWLSSRPIGPMPEALAGHIAGDPILCRKLFQAACSLGPGAATEAAQGWERALPACAPEGTPTFDALATALAAWREALSKGGAPAEEWNELGERALAAAWSLQSRMAGGPCGEASRPGFRAAAQAGFEEALLAALPKDYGHWRLPPAEAWSRCLGLALAPFGPHSPHAGRLPLDLALDDPRQWPAAALLAGAGAKARPEWLPRVKNAINAALRQGGSPSARQRALGALRLARACGAGGFNDWRDQNGQGFEPMALRAALAWSGADLAEALADFGLRWSASSMSAAPTLALAATKANPRCAWSMHAKLDAIAKASNLPFPPGSSRPWILLAARAASPSTGERPGKPSSWGPALARWGTSSGWSGPDWDALAKAWPDLSLDAAFRSASEAASLRDAVDPNPAAKRRPPRSL